MTRVPPHRVHILNDRPVRPGRYVLYWMIAARRSRANFALDQAMEHARTLGCGLVVLEALRVDIPWASARTHQFVIDGMADNRRDFEAAGVAYHPFVERRRGDGTGLLERLAADARVVVTDDYPAYFLPRMVERVAARLGTRLEAVDGNGLAPMRVAGQAFPTAYAFRRYLQGSLATHLAARPLAHLPPTAARQQPVTIPADIVGRWPAWRFGRDGDAVSSLPVDQSVATPPGVKGGATEARARLDAFVDRRLPRYGADRNDPDDDVTSGLSPYLHFGHLAADEVFDAVMRREGWLGEIPRTGRGARAGWWGVSPAAEGFLDQLVTWRELGFNMCAHRRDFDQFESLPRWALDTLERHSNDPRTPAYSREQFDEALTHDPIWNAAQRQLRSEGRMHNYLRMLWGKKILQWSETPRDALATMVELNNLYALDGRDPNSYSGIFWTLGRYDRPWGPERPVFGTVRYMSSENTARKLRLKQYLARYSSEPGLFDRDSLAPPRGV